MFAVCVCMVSNTHGCRIFTCMCRDYKNCFLSSCISGCDLLLCFRSLKTVVPFLGFRSLKQLSYFFVLDL